MKKFTEELKNRLSQELETVALDAATIKERCASSIPIINKAMLELKIFMEAYSFKDRQEEVYYYKQVIPPVHGEYIYFVRLLDLETRMPEADRKDYFRNEIKELKRFFRRNNALYQYYKMGATTLDEQFYSRQSIQSELVLDEYCPVMDSHCTTVQSFRLARFQAYEKLMRYLQEQLYQKPSFAPSAFQQPVSNIKWTESKMSLVELLYALFYSGCFNDGKIEIKDLAQTFELAFNIKLGNYYRSKQELYTRKSSAAFLDSLRKSLLKGLEDTDGTYSRQ